MRVDVNNTNMPDGWIKNPDQETVERISAALMRTNGYCPCVSNANWTDSHLCPCFMFRRGDGCHCHLYVEENQDD